MENLEAQDIHHLAMNHVGKELEALGYEFLAINSQLKKHPQFVCVDKATNTLHFVLVNAVFYPENPQHFDETFLKTFKEHAVAKKAKILFAGLGFANAENFENPIAKNEDYILNYEGIKEIF